MSPTDREGFTVRCVSPGKRAKKAGRTKADDETEAKWRGRERTHDENRVSSRSVRAVKHTFLHAVALRAVLDRPVLINPRHMCHPRITPALNLVGKRARSSLSLFRC